MGTNDPYLKSPFNVEKLWELLRSGKLKDYARKGYVAQADADGRIRMVHWSKSDTIADMTGWHGPGHGEFRNRSYGVDPNWENELTPIVKRTAQKRLDSLVSKVVKDAIATGTIPGMDDAVWKDIMGEAWKEGNPLTAEDVRRVCAFYLNKQERIQSLKNAKKTVIETPK